MACGFALSEHIQALLVVLLTELILAVCTCIIGQVLVVFMGHVTIIAIRAIISCISTAFVILYSGLICRL